jgi:hypothetical protein
MVGRRSKENGVLTVFWLKDFWGTTRPNGGQVAAAVPGNTSAW